MWTSKGRSGYGDSTIGGDYDSWDGLSMNGRQYKNEAILETRDLSGADYWHLRKQNRPTEEIPVELHMLSKGRANIAAYADPVPTKKATKVPLKNRILPQAARVEKLHAEILELESAYRSGEFSPEDYSLLREVAFKKYNRAQELLKRAVKPVEKVEDEVISYANSFSTPSDNDGHGESYSSPIGVGFIDELSSDNSLKSILKKACKVIRTVRYCSHKVSKYIQTLKEV